MLLNADADLTKCSNMIVEYSINKIDWRSNIYNILGVNGRIVENSRPINFYIKIYVNEVMEDAKFDGMFNFTLSSQE